MKVVCFVDEGLSEEDVCGLEEFFKSLKEEQRNTKEFEEDEDVESLLDEVDNANTEFFQRLRKAYASGEDFFVYDTDKGTEEEEESYTRIDDLPEDIDEALEELNKRTPITKDMNLKEDSQKPEEGVIGETLGDLYEYLTNKAFEDKECLLGEGDFDNQLLSFEDFGLSEDCMEGLFEEPDDFIRSLDQKSIDFLYTLVEELEERGIKRSTSQNKTETSWYNRICFKVGKVVDKSIALSLRGNGYSDDEICEVFRIFLNIK